MRRCKCCLGTQGTWTGPGRAFWRCTICGGHDSWADAPLAVAVAGNPIAERQREPGGEVGCAVCASFGRYCCAQHRTAEVVS